MAKMLRQEVEDWNELYEYVRHDIMGYDENQPLNKAFVLRLKGLANNKYMANKKTKNTANFSYRVILNTFKFCKLDIIRGISKTTFTNETHKMNYILKIVEKSLNDVYLRMKNTERNDIQMANKDISHILYNGADYKQKTEENNNKKLDSLW